MSKELPVFSSHLVNILGIKTPLSDHSSVSGARGRGLIALRPPDELIGNLFLNLFQRCI